MDVILPVARLLAASCNRKGHRDERLQEIGHAGEIEQEDQSLEDDVSFEGLDGLLHALVAFVHLDLDSLQREQELEEEDEQDAQEEPVVGAGVVVRDERLVSLVAKHQVHHDCACHRLRHDQGVKSNQYPLDYPLDFAKFVVEELVADDRGKHHEREV